MPRDNQQSIVEDLNILTILQVCQKYDIPRTSLYRIMQRNNIKRDKTSICKDCGAEVKYKCKRPQRCDNCYKINNNINGRKNKKIYKENGKLKEYMRNFLSTDKGKLCRRKVNFRRRIKFINLIESYTYIEWNTKLDKTNGICPKCNIFVGKNKLTIDHIIPISKAPEGFIYTINDIQPLCHSCNSKKGDKIE